jgi:hypothetical protein
MDSLCAIDLHGSGMIDMHPRFLTGSHQHLNFSNDLAGWTSNFDFHYACSLCVWTSVNVEWTGWKSITTNDPLL